MSEPQMEILIVTHARDMEFLRYCVRSIAMFGRGFSGLTLVVPASQIELFDWVSNLTPTQIVYGDEKPKKGFLTHLIQKCWADKYCPQADFILHVDPDTLFTGPTTPADFLEEYKPILYREKYADLVNDHRKNWQHGVAEATGIIPVYETMVRAPHVHHRATYTELRQAVQRHTGKPFEMYVLSGKNEWPQDFCEFNSLGAVAIERFPDRYSFVDYDRAADAKRYGLVLKDGGWQYVYKRSRDKVIEVWSHSGISAHRKLFEKILNRDAPAHYTK